MTEFIGSRISLVSRSDIRYVGTLHEINSETSTVALEHVSSFGTEGRKDNPDDEIPPSDSVYEYIVFRGSDVKDLKIEEAPASKEKVPPQVPNDPAILGSGSRPQAEAQTQAPTPRQTQRQQIAQSSSGPQSTPGTSGTSGPPGPLGPLGPPGPPPPQGLPQFSHPSSGPPQFPPHPQFPAHFYPPPSGPWARGAPIPGTGYPGMPYGAPPNWYPPPGQGFPHGGPFPYVGFPPGPPGQHFPQQPKAAPISAGAKQQAPGELSAEKPFEPKASAKSTAQDSIATDSSSSAPPKVAKTATSEVKVTTNSSKPAAPAAAITAPTAPKDVAKPTLTGAKNGRIMPAIPLQSPVPAKTLLEAAPINVVKTPATQGKTTANRAAVDDATQAATAAVAAAMAKLPPLAGQQANGNTSVDNLTRKVKEMRASDPNRGIRHSGGGHRGRGRGGHSLETAKFEVPAADFDFESSNAKFNKQDLVKEAVAGSPLAETPPGGLEDSIGSVLIPPPGTYNKKSSFFDDLSSEIKDRTDGSERPGGRVWRGEEQRKNLETFGQGSVDNGYRGGYRGRGRGRGGHRGRGYGGNGQPGVRGGRGAYRGGRGESQAISH